MPVVFAWDRWNREHVKKHGSTAKDAKYVVQRAEPPFPREIGGDKYLVWGRTETGNYLEVIFAFKRTENLEFGDLDFLDWGTVINQPETISIYICHAMPMKTKQLRQYRKLRNES